MFCITKSKLLFLSAFSFLLGIFISSFVLDNFFIDNIYIFSLACLFLILSTLFYQKEYFLKSDNNGFKLWIFFFLLSFFFLAFWRYNFSINISEINFRNKYDKQNILMKGNIISNPIFSNKSQNFIFDGVYQGEHHKIILYTNLYPEYRYGDYLEISGTLKIPEEFHGFDFERYLRNLNIYALLYYPEINILDRGRGNKIKSFIYNLKNEIRIIFDSNLDRENLALAKACFLGDKKAIPDNLRVSFARSGLSHIMAISGLHISIFILIFMNLCLSIGIKRQRALILTFIFLLFYLFLIAMPASAVRASIMGIVALMAFNSGRVNNPFRILILAASFMLILNPRLLRDDLGFQLSFLSVLGIILFFPLLNKFFLKFIPEKLKDNIFIKSCFSIISITISAQIFIWPLLIKNFSQISLIAPISNLFVLWVLAFLIVALIIALILSFIFPYFSLAFFVFPKIILIYIIFIANFFSKYSFFYKEIYYLSPIFLFLYFSFISIIIYWYSK